MSHRTPRKLLDASHLDELGRRVGLGLNHSRSAQGERLPHERFEVSVLKQ